MPLNVIHPEVCPKCPFGFCIEDLRSNPVRGRDTKFRLKQNVALGCTFDEFVPGTDNDPDPSRTYDQYLERFSNNAKGAGAHLYDQFQISQPAIAKVEGDVFELLEAAALWNAASVWNHYMSTGLWTSNVFSIPAGAIVTPSRKVAIVKLPRGYDATRLFKPEVRSSIKAHEQALRLRDMELGLSSPDIVGIRIPEPPPPEYAVFSEQLTNLGDENRTLVENASARIEGTLEGRAFLFAIAVKRTTRSDRLYQALFEANVLKYLIEVVLRGAAFKFSVHMGSFEGADVKNRYKAASLISLMRGGEPSLAVDRLYKAEQPMQAAQMVLNDLPLFPL
jgi:hypothetical protein